MTVKTAYTDEGRSIYRYDSPDEKKVNISELNSERRFDVPVFELVSDR